MIFTPSFRQYTFIKERFINSRVTPVWSSVCRTLTRPYNTSGFVPRVKNPNPLHEFMCSSCFYVSAVNRASSVSDRLYPGSSEKEGATFVLYRKYVKNPHVLLMFFFINVLIRCVPVWLTQAENMSSSSHGLFLVKIDCTTSLLCIAHIGILYIQHILK